MESKYKSMYKQNGNPIESKWPWNWVGPSVEDELSPLRILES